jgi:uncharacterized membrane protein
MRRSRIISLFTAVALASLAFAPSALAETHGGEGIWGSSNLTQQTYAMYIVIGLIALIIIVLSLVQAWLDHRKHARLDAAKRRESAAEWKGGW